MAHDRLLTNEVRWHIGMSMSARCERCGDILEDSLHVLGDCTFARDVWGVFRPQAWIKDFASLPLRDWILENLKANGEDRQEIGWPARMAVIVWMLWRWRNMEIFKHERLPLPHRIQTLLQLFDEAKMIVNRVPP